MPAPLTVRRVDSKADYRTFLTFPWTVYRSAPNWTPPLMSVVREHMDRQHSPTWEHIEGEYFIAWRGDQPVGTVAAFINHRHNEYWDENIGFFGAFEVLDDQEAITVLLDTAAEWVAAKGATAIRGPMTFSTNGEVGVLVDGFDDPNVLMYPWTYPYYAKLIEQTPGFVPVMDFYAYHFALDRVHNSETLEKLFRITARNAERRQITIRTLNPKRLDDEFLLLKSIYNKAWERNWGFVPFSDRELDEMVAAIGQFLDPRMAFFAEVEGVPRGFILALPDMHQAIRHAWPRPGKPEVLTLLHLLWHWKIRPKVNRVRIMLMGIEEGYRNIGIDAAMFVHTYQTGVKLDWHIGDGGWVLKTNDAMNRLAETLHGRRYKTFRVYERTLAASQGERDA
jgi:hypothetical protein